MPLAPRAFAAVLASRRACRSSAGVSNEVSDGCRLLQLAPPFGVRFHLACQALVRILVALCGVERLGGHIIGAVVVSAATRPTCVSFLSRDSAQGPWLTRRSPPSHWFPDLSGTAGHT